MYALSDAIDRNTGHDVHITVIHTLPGRLRFHLSEWPTGAAEFIEEIVVQVRGVRSVEANQVTGNVLVHYNTAFIDQQSLLHAVHAAVLCAPSRIEAREEVGTDIPMADGAPDSIRLVLPIVHLVYSCSPLGVAMHVAEIGWAIKGKRVGRGAMPALHLICCFSPLSLLLHLSELTWALAPFVPPRETSRPIPIAPAARRFNE